MDDGLAYWSTRPVAGGVVELRDSNGVRLMLAPREQAQRMADLHNHDVERARELIGELRASTGERTTIGDVEALLVRVLVAALKELARGALPHRLRRRSQPVRNPVHGA